MIAEPLPDRLQRISAALAVIRGRPWRPSMFGVEEHQFRLGPPLAEEDVAAFERSHEVALPEGYRAFVTRIGHGGPGRYGGAGPFYGLLPLDRWDEALTADACPGVLGVPFPAAPGREYGTDWLGEAGLAEDGAEWFPGALALSHAGCGDMAVLVVTGPGRGRVAYTRGASQPPYYPRDEDFLGWYQRWLDAVLARERWWF